jgi:predicted dehydrogenase
MKRRHFLATMGKASTGLAVGVSFSRLNTFAAAAGTGAKPPKLRIGQIGTAHAHAAGKIAALQRSGDFDVAGVVEPDPMRRQRAEESREYQGVRWVTEEQLLNLPGLQAVAIETEVGDLLATAARVVAAGKHVHLDKPAGESLTAFKELLDEATRRRLTVQMGYMFRYNPALQFCYRAVREGWLGEIFSIDAVMGKVLDAESRKALLKYRGGAMFELGCHVIDSVVHLMGRPQRVVAHNRSSSSTQDGLADNQLAVLEYPKAAVTVRSSIMEVAGEARRQFVVCGDQGTIDIRPIEPPQVRLALAQPRGDFKKGYQDIPMTHRPRYEGDFMDLAKVIRGEKEFDFPPAHDLAVQEAVLLASGLPRQ